MPLLAVFLLQACSASIVSSKSNFDSALIQECSSPKVLPVKDLSQREVERYWTQDRKNLVVCRDRHSGLVSVLK